MSLRIRIEHGQDAGRTWRLTKPGLYVLGRTPETAIRVLDMKISKEHARVVLAADGESAWIEDLGSRHGTELNGQPLRSQRHPLHAGDEIRLGLSILRVLSDGEADATAEPDAPLAAGAAAPSTTQGAPAQGAPPAAAAGAGRVLPPDELVGQEIGGYKVLRKIGQGGMGSVYVAEQLSLHREVALKVLSGKFTSDRAFVDQFVNEARSAAALNHPNVVQVYDVGRENGRYYFSMEYVPGGSLEERVARDGPAPWQDALNWMIDAANALIFAAKRGILHRDVKPDNLMVAEDQSAKLCDLGLAKKAANPDMLAAGIIGTPAFISPEAIRRKKEIDARSDLYSLGCTFYRVLTGENPFPGKSVKDILLGHLRNPVPRVSDKRPDVPKDLDDAIYQLMQKEPEGRYATAEDLLVSLDRVRIQHGLEAHGLRPPSRKPLVIALALLLVGLGIALYALTRPSPDVPRGLSPEEKAKIEKQRREAEENELKAAIATAESAYRRIQLERLSPPLGIDNFDDERWERIAGDFDRLATELAADAKFGNREEINEWAEKAREAAQEIRDGVQIRRELATDVRNARAAEVTRLDEALGKIKTAYDAALQQGDWLAAAAHVDPEAIDALVKPFREKSLQSILPDKVPPDVRQKFGEDLLLDPQEHVQKTVAKYFPGEVPGEALREAVATEARRIHDQHVNEIRATVAEKNHDAYARALEQITKWLELLPEAPDGAKTAVAEAVRSWRREAENLRAEVEREDALLLQADIQHDREAYFGLLRALRKPGAGLFFAFRWDEAAKKADEVAQAMRYPKYADQAAASAADARAVGALLGHLQSSFPDGWTSDKVTVLDDKGRESTERVKGVSAAGLTLGGEELSWARLGARWLLERLLFPPDGETRVSLTAEDHHGVAVLAEMAVDYDRAARHYQTFLATPDLEATGTMLALRRRLGRLAEERVAGEAWRVATTNLAAVQAFVRAHDPRLIGEEAFWNDEALRQEIQAQEGELRRLLTEARTAQATLQDPRLASTTWASVVRDAPLPGAAYAGEPKVDVPPPPGDETPPPPKAPDAPTPPDDGDG